MTSQRQSLRALAHAAGVSASTISRFLNHERDLEVGAAVKIYQAIRRDLPPMSRRSFLVAAGLVPLAAALGGDLSATSASEPVNTGMVQPDQVALENQLLSFAKDFMTVSWEKGIILLSTVEEVTGQASALGARAALMGAQAYINLGNYGRAEAEVARAAKTYSLALDDDLRHEIYRLEGWLDYYQHRLQSAKGRFLACIALQRERGRVQDAESAVHFLGRVYRDMARGARDSREAAALYQKAERQFDNASKIHASMGIDSSLAFDLFRKAQSLQMRNEWREAQTLRQRARVLFGRDMAVAHIDLEEARIALEDGDDSVAARNARRSVEAWSEIKYAKGIADSLLVLGLCELTKGNADEALKLYAAGLIAYPYHLDNPHNRAELADICLPFHRSKTSAQQVQLLCEIETSASDHSGTFSYLERVAADRSPDVQTVLAAIRAG